ncbi:hypothetical protein RB195_000289 [Necator americanus]|uniref:Transporter, major facilitator family protein n=1 Tax=Necator americanus TaxID=51031 RepID=A0ABR1DBY1_NECAM
MHRKDECIASDHKRASPISKIDLPGGPSDPLCKNPCDSYVVVCYVTISSANEGDEASSRINHWLRFFQALTRAITPKRTLFILPTAGYLCTRKDILDGWPAIFYLSACISILVTVFWIPFGADKPSKQCCISGRERNFIESRIACESIGKRTDRSRRVPYQAMLKSGALWASIFALVCHEYPLVIMLQFLPNYMRDVLEFAPTQNGLIAALPILCLFLSKTVSSSFASYLVTKRDMDKTVVCKGFNAVASGGLAMCIFIVPLFDKTRAVFAVVSLCGAMVFAGMHTPGVITALVQLAPPFSGIITGWSFFAVAWFSIMNKILTKHIVQQGAASEWSMVFRVSALVAALPVFVFTWWGSADRQVWAAPSSKASVCSFSPYKKSKNGPGSCSQLSRETSLSSLSTRDGMSAKKKLSTSSMSRSSSLAKNLNESKIGCRRSGILGIIYS